MEYSGVNVFRGIPTRSEEPALWRDFIESHDLAPGSVRGMVFDIRRFARWFASTNHEPYSSARVTTSDVAGFREQMRRQRGLAVATVNRNLVTVRRYFDHLLRRGDLSSSPAKSVKELRRQRLCPKGLDRREVRRLLREVELRGDVRARAIFSLMLYTGARVGDIVNLELRDLIINERSGHVVFRFGKGNKQRSVPLPLPARRSMEAYLETRPPAQSMRVFQGERGALTDRGIRALCSKYSAICGLKFSPHHLRHSFSHAYLRENPGDIVGLAQLLGHESLNTTAIYTQRSSDSLAQAADRLAY